MTYDAVLLDLYDTLVWSDWHSWQGRLADRLGVTLEAMGQAFSRTRPARSVGAYPDTEADIVAVLEAADVAPTPELIAELLAMEDAHGRLGAAVRRFPRGRAGVARPGRADRAREQLLAQHAPDRRSARARARSSTP